jgi:hypothetical protein
MKTAPAWGPIHVAVEPGLEALLGGCVLGERGSVAVPSWAVARVLLRGRAGPGNM